MTCRRNPLTTFGNRELVMLERLAATIHTRHLFRFTKLEFARRFVDIFRRDENRISYIDHKRFHDTEPSVDGAAGS